PSRARGVGLTEGATMIHFDISLRGFTRLAATVVLAAGVIGCGSSKQLGTGDTSTTLAPSTVTGSPTSGDTPVTEPPKETTAPATSCAGDLITEQTPNVQLINGKVLIDFDGDRPLACN